MTHEIFPGGPSPEKQLYDLLPAINENFTPQLGYRLSLSGLALSDLDRAQDYHRLISNAVDADITNRADFDYTYNPLNDVIDLETIRLELRHPLVDEQNVIADCVYVQHCRDGFVRSLGLGEETLAANMPNPYMITHDTWSGLLNPVGLYSIKGGDQLAGTVANKLSEAPQWRIREQQTIPLPPDGISQKQLIIARTRTARPIETSIVEDPDRNLYLDDYEITFQTIFQPTKDPYVQPIEEASLLVHHSSENQPAITMVEKQYDHYAHPLVIGLSEVLRPKAVSYEPEPGDIAAFVTLLENFAA